MTDRSCRKLKLRRLSLGLREVINQCQRSRLQSFLGVEQRDDVRINKLQRGLSIELQSTIPGRQVALRPGANQLDTGRVLMIWIEIDVFRTRSRTGTSGGVHARGGLGMR